jgi:hypothetical protein
LRVILNRNYAAAQPDILFARLAALRLKRAGRHPFEHHAQQHYARQSVGRIQPSAHSDSCTVHSKPRFERNYVVLPPPHFSES